MSKEAIVLKRDAGGRVLVPVARRVELVREFEHSGLSGPKFATLAGVNYQSFAAWHRKHGRGPAMRRTSQRKSPDSGWGLGSGCNWLTKPCEAAAATTQRTRGLTSADLVASMGFFGFLSSFCERTCSSSLQSGDFTISDGWTTFAQLDEASALPFCRSSRFW